MIVIMKVTAPPKRNKRIYFSCLVDSRSYTLYFFNWLGAGLFGAVANVCFPSLTILTTSLIGGAGMSVCCDYFMEKLKGANWMWAHIKEKQEVQFCWFTWLMLALWPVLVIFGVLIQATLTARGFTIQTCKSCLSLCHLNKVTYNPNNQIMSTTMS